MHEPMPFQRPASGALKSGAPDLLFLWPLLMLPSPSASNSQSYAETVDLLGIKVTIRKAAVKGHGTNVKRPERCVEDDLLLHLRSLGITAYEQLIAQLLTAVGYTQVRVLRSTQERRSHKGRNRHGGVDIIATGRSGLSRDAVLVQVKQYERPVSRRFVDELRGALLRTESRHALLITTSRFSPAANKAAQEDHIAPVHLMDGNRLCALLMQHQIGVRHDRKNRLGIDDSFFRRLKKKHPVPSPNAPTIRSPDSVTPSGKSRKPVTHLPRSLDSDQGQKGGEMMGRTHALLGIATLWLLKPFGVITPDNLAPLVLIAVLGALSPDLDASESKLKRFAVAGITPFVPLSQLLHQSFGHRGLLHSWLASGLFTLLCALPLALWLGGPFGAMLSLGYASHLLADSANEKRHSAALSSPQTLPPTAPGWRFTTGSHGRRNAVALPGVWPSCFCSLSISA